MTNAHFAPVAVVDQKSTMQGAAIAFPATDLTVNDSPGPADESGDARESRRAPDSRLKSPASHRLALRGLTAAELLAAYARLSVVVSPTPLPAPISRRLP